MNTAYMWGLKLAEEDPTAAELPGTAPNPPGFFSTVGKPLLGAAAAATLLYGGYKAHQLSPQFREELRYQRRTWPSAARLAAIGPPMLPNPINPIFITQSS